MTDRDEMREKRLELERKEVWKPPTLVSLEAVAKTLGQASGPSATDGGTYPVDYNS